MMYKKLFDTSFAEIDGAGARIRTCTIEDITLQAWMAAGNTPLPIDPPTTAEVREIAKAVRTAAVAAITVTTSTGKVFDGDETSQTRMSRAIIGMQAAGAATLDWTLADNTIAAVTLAELTEAMVLAGQEQSRLWVL